MTNLPERAGRPEVTVTPSLLRAAVSPGALVLAAAGAGIGLLVFHTWVVAVILAFVGWSARMAAAGVAARRHRLDARPRPAEIDPWSVPEPWRPLLQQAAAAQGRFDRVVADWPPGPLRDRLVSMQPRVWSDVGDLAAMARRGAALTGWNGAAPAPGRPTVEGLSAELRGIGAERAGLGPGPSARAGELDRREEAVAAQLRSLRRSEQAAAELADRMRSALALLEQSVTGLLALGGQAAGTPPALESLEQLSLEVAALQAAVAETSGTPPEPTTP